MSKKLNRFFGLGVFFIALTAAGCADKMNMDQSAIQRELDQKDKALQALKVSNSDQEQQIRNYQAKLNAQNNMGSSVNSLDLLPPNANPGQCFARVFVPPKYETTSEQMLKHDATERLEIVPATYQWVEEEVLVQEASERIELIPAKYGWVEEKVMVKSASSQMEQIPARYEWVEEKVLVKPSHTTWKTGRGLVERLDNTTGEIMCLVTVPASYRTVKKRVLREPVKTMKTDIPASYQTVKKRVMTQQATQRKIEIPAKYKTVKVRKMVNPPQERRIAIPASYQTVSGTKLVSDGKMEWRQVLCETNLTPDIVSRLQSALQKSGYNPGPIDGTYGMKTQSAVRSFQKSKGLPTGGLTHGTIKRLGVSI